MTEYEINKRKIREYRKRSRGYGFILFLCGVMDWINEHCIKEN